MINHILVKVVRLKFLQWFYKFWVRPIYPSIDCINRLVHLFAFWLWNFLPDIFLQQNIWNYNWNNVVVVWKDWYFLERQFFFRTKIIIPNLIFFVTDIVTFYCNNWNLPIIIIKQPRKMHLMTILNRVGKINLRKILKAVINDKLLKSSLEDFSLREFPMIVEDFF